MPSIFWGAMIVAGTSIGAGMFSLPVVASGMWFTCSLVMLVFVWFCMYSSGLMLLETNLHFPQGSSFDTHARETLGNRARIINGLSVTFVLYILTYAYVSGGGSILSYTLENSFDISLSQPMGSAVFGVILAAIVVVGTGSVGRIASVMLSIMFICFILSMSQLLKNVSLTHLFPIKNSESYWTFSFMALSFFLTSFGYHGNVPGLVKYYKGNADAVRKTLLYGSLTALICYILWLVGTMGVVARDAWKPVISQGGNMGMVVKTLEQAVDNDLLLLLLKLFSNFAVASSFLGVTLGLFDYMADTFQFNDQLLGRLKSGLITFAPPVALGIIFPNGFIMAIGFAAVAATIFAVITPALMLIAIRKKYNNQTVSWQMAGGWPRLVVVLLFGVAVIIFHSMSLMNLLPLFT